MNCSNTIIPTFYFCIITETFSLAKPNRFIVSNPSGVAITEPQDLQEAQSLLASVDDETQRLTKQKQPHCWVDLEGTPPSNMTIPFKGGQLLLIEMLFPEGLSSTSWCHQNKMSASKT